MTEVKNKTIKQKKQTNTKWGCGSILVGFTKPHLNTDTNQRKAKDLEV